MPLLHHRKRSRRPRALWAGAWLGTLTLGGPWRCSPRWSACRCLRHGLLYRGGQAGWAVPHRQRQQDGSGLQGKTFIWYGTTVPGLSNPKATTVPEHGHRQDRRHRQLLVRQHGPAPGQPVRRDTQHRTRRQQRHVPGHVSQQGAGPEVKQAEADGLVVVINDQTESDSNAISANPPARNWTRRRRPSRSGTA